MADGNSSTPVRFLGGTNIENAAQELVAVANRDGEAHGDFNDITLRAKRDDLPESIVAAYDRETKARAAAYRSSPEGKAAAERDRQERQDLQSEHDRLMAALRTLDWNNKAAVLDWCCAMQKPSDRIGVIIRRDTIIAEFAKRGFTPNMRTGEDYIEQKTVAHAYIVGQALRCLETVGAIHGIIHKFADEWRQRYGAKAAA